MLKIFKRKKKDNSIRLKKITNFSRVEILCLDDILFMYYRVEGGYFALNLALDTHLKKYEYSNAKISELFLYLCDYKYIDEVKEGEFAILNKGVITCQQGGLNVLYEKAKSQNYSKWISIISACIAVCALIANILFSYLKEC